MTRILGIDPGTGILGFGVIDFDKQKSKLVTAGVIRTPAHTPLEDRLLEIYDGLSEIISETKPQVMSIEKLFFARNVTTAISVSHARGVAMLTARQANLRICEYTPLQIKQALTGYGKADKKQVQEMVRLHLNLKEAPKPDDCADALAAAIICAFSLRSESSV
jgi:crossover junction endodeoxyribonuclease RuvC